MARYDFDSLMNQLRNVRSLSDTAGAHQGQLPDYLGQYRKMYGVGSPVNLPNSVGNTGGGDQFSRFVNAIAQQESGGSYKQVNPDSGALGRYQIMPGNVPSWSKRVLGRTLTSKQFLNSPALQDQIAQSMLRSYVKKYGYSGAAAAWYGGEGVARNWSSRTNPQGRYPSIAKYVQQILKRMG